jgi:hypothetical protein
MRRPLRHRIGATRSARIGRIGHIHRIHHICAAGGAGMLAVWLAGCGALVTSTPPIHATYSTHVTTPHATPNTTAPVYQDTLMGASAPTGWSTQPVCAFSAQGLVVNPSGGQAYICLAPATPLADVAVTVTAEQLSGSTSHAFGIAFHHNEPKSYYFFGVDGRGRYTLAVVTNDISHTVIPFTANAAIRSGIGTPNVLQMVSKGQQLTLFVNGATVGEAMLSTFATGTVGLRGINDGQARFSNLTIAKA